MDSRVSFNINDTLFFFSTGRKITIYSTKAVVLVQKETIQVLFI